jgi:HEAT repeat protein
MRQRKVTFIVLPILLAIAAIWMLVSGEPGFRGRGLRSWLRSLDKSPLEFTGLAVETNQPAAHAFVQMGGKAVPHLVRELRVRDTAWKIKLRGWLGRESVFGIDLTPAYVRQRRAIQACYALGPAAKAAIPDLSERLNEQRISQTLRTLALAAIGPDALPFMIGALTNSDPQVRLYMSLAFRYVSFDADAAVPALVRCLSDPQDYRIRCEAAMALGHIRKRPELVVPALTQNLTDTNETVRSLTATALSRFRDTPLVTP